MTQTYLDGYTLIDNHKVIDLEVLKAGELLERLADPARQDSVGADRISERLRAKQEKPA